MRLRFYFERSILRENNSIIVYLYNESNLDGKITSRDKNSNYRETAVCMYTATLCTVQK